MIFIKKKIRFNNTHMVCVNDYEKKTKPGYKVIKLINTECVSCYKEMEEWNNLIKTNKLFQDLQIVCIASGTTNDYFKFALKEQDYHFEIWLDSLDMFKKENNLEKYTRETFLLNNNDLIILVGSPLEDFRITSLYEFLIRKSP